MVQAVKSLPCKHMALSSVSSTSKKKKKKKEKIRDGLSKGSARRWQSVSQQQTSEKKEKKNHRLWTSSLQNYEKFIFVV
jgi:hypothetical protein